MLIRFFILIQILIISGSLYAQQLDLCSGHLVTIEPGGAISAGSKEAVIKAVRSGTPIRVGWSLDFNNDGKAELAHWADAIFLTEFEGEIFTQITEIQQQAPIRGKARVDLGVKPLRWTGLIGTNGMLEGRFNDDQPVTNHPVKTEWCIDSRVQHIAAKVDQQDCTAQWRLAYHHEKDGSRISGSKDELFRAIRRGYPIRLAWGSSFQKDEQKLSVEHAAEPIFLTIMNGSELAVQVPEHIGQTSYWDPSAAKFDNPQIMWRGIFSTTGEFDAVFVDRATGETTKRIPQRARIVWFVMSPPFDCESSSPEPVLAVPQGVVRKD